MIIVASIGSSSSSPTEVQERKRNIALEHSIILFILGQGKTKMESITSETEERSSWMDWFNSRESAPKINSGAKQALFKIFDASHSKSQIKSELLKHTETVFIFKQNFGINKINIFHHLSLIGGNFYELQEHFGAIQGIEEGTTSVVTPDMDQLLEISAVATPVPNLEEYMKMESNEEYKHLKASKDSYYTARNFIPVPPFLLNEISDAISEYDGDSKQVLARTIQVIKDFDNQVEELEDENIEKADITCTDLLHWLFLATKGKINSIPTIACSVKEVRKHFSEMQKLYKIEGKTNVPKQPIQDIALNMQKPLEIIAASSSSTQDFLSKLTQLHTTAQEKSSNSFGKLSDKVQNMMLIASSRGTVIPTSLNDEAMTFFKTSSISKAQQFLENQLEAKGIECTVPTAVANLWLHGCFLWTNPLTPSGIASSVIASKDIIFNDSIHEGILLDFSTKHEISKNSLSKLTKTQVIYPNSIEPMIERIEAILVFTNLFFEDKSYLSQGLKILLTLCKTNKTLLRTKLYLDRMFIAKFLFSIDDRINKWLSECSRVASVDQTCMELVDFGTLITDLKLNRFYCDLPDSIKMIANDQDLQKDNTTNQGIKKRKANDSISKQSPKIIVNDDLRNEWKLPEGESWQLWRHKVGQAPTLQCKAKPCLKYHIKGSCFEDCTNKASHTNLVGEDYKKTDEFIRKTRASMN